MVSANKVDNKIILILDAQSSVVQGTLAIVGHGIPKVIFTYSADVNIKSNSGNDLLVKTTLSVIKEVIDSASRFLHHSDNLKDIPRLHKKIHAVHYVLSSPWIVSDAKVLSKRFDTKEAEITQKYILDLIDADNKSLIQSDEPLQIIEQKIFDVKLNGYSVSDWEHKNAKDLEVSFTASMINSNMLNYFIDQCKHIVHQNKIYFHSSLLLQFIGIEEVLELGKNYCLIHVHGNNTDVSMVKKESCIFFGSYSFGIKDFIENLAKETGNGLQASDSLLALYVDNKLNNSENKKNIVAIEKVSKLWLDGLKNILTEQKLDIKPPNSVILNCSTHNACFVKVIQDSIPGVSIYTLSIDDLLHRVSFDHLTDTKILTALYTIAIHSLNNNVVLK
jgi:hypothetical protein